MKELGGLGKGSTPGPPTRADWQELDRLGDLCGEYVRRHPQAFSRSKGCQEAALRRLLATPGDEYATSRGAMVGAHVDKIALPTCGEKFDVGEFLPEFRDWENVMLAPEEERREYMEHVNDVKAYADPKFRRPGSKDLLRLAVRLYKAGLVKPVKKRGPIGVTLFTVVKSDGVQRLIFDMRRANGFFRRPKGCVLGSGAALAALDLSEGAIGLDDVRAAAGDLPNFFYTLTLGESFGSWVWLEGLDVRAFAAALVAEGLLGSEEAAAWGDAYDAVGFTCLPMGFAWAPLVAQRVLEGLLAAAGEAEEAQMRHGHPAPAVSREAGPNMSYIDDFLLVARAPRHHQGADGVGAEEQARERLASVRGTLHKAGLGCHKEQAGAVLTILGFEADFRDKVCRPRPEKLVELVRATRALLG